MKSVAWCIVSFIYGLDAKIRLSERRQKVILSILSVSILALATQRYDFSFNPPIGKTRPLRVISPVIPTSRFTAFCVKAETKAVTIVTPADGPSLGIAPSGT